MKVTKYLHILLITICVSTFSSQVNCQKGNIGNNNDGTFSFITNSFTKQLEKYKVLLDREKVENAISDLYDLFTQNDNYKRKLREKHEKYGALRSGEGNAADIMRRMEE